MVLPRGSESWRRMSRFRRQSLVKPLAAEVLEPRCLMTDATGTLATADAAPLTGAVVVDASLWDDAGLTLRQLGDLLHVFRTGTQIDVITPMLAREITSLIIIGRTNVPDLLTFDVSFGWSLANGALQLDMESDQFGNEWRTIQPVLVEAEVWDTAGLTVRRVDDQLHVFCDDKEVAVFPTLAASEVGRLNIVGGTDTTNIVRVDQNELVLFLATYSSDSLDRIFNGGYCRIRLTTLYSEDSTESSDSDRVLEDGSGDSLEVLPSSAQLIGQGIATVGIEDRELAEFDTASSDSAFGELADSEPEDGEDSETLAANGDTNSADVSGELELDAALSNELLTSLTQNLRSGANS